GTMKFQPGVTVLENHSPLLTLKSSSGTACFRAHNDVAGCFNTSTSSLSLCHGMTAKVGKIELQALCYVALAAGIGWTECSKEDKVQENGG
uniref:Uncharacterized protein n=1 Tax=Myripristis murdjan TaxID=586833 RepID=A0A667WJ06_9TELE